MASQGLNEILFVGTKSANSNSTLAVNPLNGHALWSHKGNEFRGSESSIAESVGQNGDFIAVASSAQPFLHFINVKKSTITTTLAGKPDALQITRSGRFGFVLVNSKIYCYDIRTGELNKIVTNLFLKANKMFLCPNDQYLALPMADGTIFVYKVSSLICRSAISEESVAPFCSYRAHTKAIADIAFSCFDSLFMVSCGLDHRLVLYNLQSEEDPKQELLKINFDVELTACALSLSDTVLFVGTKTGRLVKLSLFQTQQFEEATHIVQTQNAGENKTHTVFDKHEGTAISKICVNLDGSRLATGDVEGKVFIWDAISGQILSRVRKDGEIHTLRWQNYWEFLTDSSYEPDTSSVQKFQHEISEDVNQVVKCTGALNDEQRGRFKNYAHIAVNEHASKNNTASSKRKSTIVRETPVQVVEEDDRDEVLENLSLNDEIRKIMAQISKLRSENDYMFALITNEKDAQVE